MRESSADVLVDRRLGVGDSPCRGVWGDFLPGRHIRGASSGADCAATC